MKEPTETIIPFSGNPAATFRGHERHRNYGMQPGATPLVGKLAASLHETLEQCAPHAWAAAAKTTLRGYLCEPELLAMEQRAGDCENYRRHLLYADPGGSFSILAIVWYPGQRTPVHGHTAWGTVGVYEGTPYCEIFDTSTGTQPAMNLTPKMRMQLKVGDLSTVQPGIDDVHRIGNACHSRCITLHVYGRDLLAHPGSINIAFNPS